MKLAIFTSQEFASENNSFSPSETAIWFHEKFKVKRNIKEHLNFFMNWINGSAGETVACGVDPEQWRLVKRRGRGENPGCEIPVFPRASLGKGWRRGGTNPWARKEEHRTL